MGDKAWKAFERDIAKQFQTSRMLAKGTAEKSDIKHNVFCVDCKLQKRWSIAQWFRELRAAATKADKIPLLIAREPQKHLTLAICELHVFVSLMRRSGLIENVAQDAPGTQYSPSDAVGGREQHGNDA